MTVQHEDIADPYIHEPKGVAAASADTVYVADGAGGGTWQKLDSDEFDVAAVETFVQDALDDGSVTVTGKMYLHTVIEDISTASSVLVPLPHDCEVKGATCVLGGAIATADATISFVNAAAASLGTAVTVAFSGSAEGDIDSFTATSNNELTGPTYIKISTDGASDNAVPLYITVEVEVQLTNV